MYHELSDSRIVHARFPNEEFLEGYYHINSMARQDFEAQVIEVGVSLRIYRPIAGSHLEHKHNVSNDRSFDCPIICMDSNSQCYFVH